MGAGAAGGQEQAVIRFPVLVVERDEPYRFVPLVGALAAAGHPVMYATPSAVAVPGASALRFDRPRPSGERVHPHVVDTERAVRTGQAVVRAVAGRFGVPPADAAGWVPRAMPPGVPSPGVPSPWSPAPPAPGPPAPGPPALPPFAVVVHRGEEGTGLFLHEVLPGCRQLAFVDGYFVPLARLAGRAGLAGRDGNAGPGGRAGSPPAGWPAPAETESEAEALRRRTGNVPVLYAVTYADAVVCPTAAQRAQFPDVLQPKIGVLHLGVDVEHFQPHPGGLAGAARSPLDAARPEAWVGTVNLAASPELVVAPAPGGGDPPDQLFAALGLLLSERPQARAVIVAQSGEALGALRAAAAEVDEARCLVVVRPTLEERLRLLRAASVLVRVGARAPLDDLVLEAMAAGVVVAAAVTPVAAEVVHHGADGYLASPEPAALASLAAWVLDHSEQLGPVRRAARAGVVGRYGQATQLGRAVGLVRQVHDGQLLPVRPPDHVPYRRRRVSGVGASVVPGAVPASPVQPPV